MTARRTLAWRVPGAPAEILTRLRDPDVARRRAESDPSLPARVTELGGSEDGPEALVITVEADLPAAWIPPQVAGRLTTAPRVVRREVWRLADEGVSHGCGAAHADIDLRLEGVPATTLTVHGLLEPERHGAPASTLTYELSLTVAVPLLGGAIERAVMERLVAGYEKEAHVIAGS